MRGEIERRAAACSTAGGSSAGPRSRAFERELAAAPAARHAVGVSSGTDALLATLMALGVGPGDEVVTTPLSFFATAGAIARLGARPVFADIDDATLHPRSGGRARGMQRAHDGAIVPVHLFGRPAALPAVAGRAGRRGRGAGDRLRPGARARRDAVVLPDQEPRRDRRRRRGAHRRRRARRSDRLLRTHGARPRYHHVAIGGNFRLDALQAAALAREAAAPGGVDRRAARATPRATARCSPRRPRAARAAPAAPAIPRTSSTSS